jgi:probable HAF family extracellular repeat protein
MFNYLQKLLGAIAVYLCWSSLFNISLCQQYSTVIDLGTLGGSESYASAINNAGQVVGTSLLSDGTFQAFIWENNMMTGLSTLGPESGAEDINDAGQVVGYTYDGEYQYAFLWENGVMNPIIGPGSFAYGINNTGDVVGSFPYEYPYYSSIHAFLKNYYSPYPPLDLGTLEGDDWSYALGLNDLGEVVGASGFSKGPPRAFLYNHAMIELESLGGDEFSSTYAVAINNAGEVVGVSQTEIPIPYLDRAVLWDGGSPTELGTLGGDNSYASDINNEGWVVGYSYLPDNSTQHAFFWKSGMEMIDLNTLIDPDSGWVLNYATSISDSGMIVGFGIHNGVEHAFLLYDLPFITITRPRAEKDTLWIAGEIDTIRWIGGKTAQPWQLEYSTDSGQSFNFIAYGSEASDGFFDWDIPDSILSTKCMIRIFDTDDTTIADTSDMIKIKGYVLTRLDLNGQYEPYLINEDSWNFKNSKNNMWPEDWWQQFDYQNDIDFFTGQLYPLLFTRWPINAEPSDFPDWELFVRTFGVEQCYYEYGSTKIYSPRAVFWWKALKKNWPGSCFGFAISSLTAFVHPQEFQEWTGLPSFDNLYSVNLDDLSRRVINMYYTYQIGHQDRQNKKDNYNKNVNETLEELKLELLSDVGDRVIRCFEDGKNDFGNGGKGNGGHALVPYKVVKDETDPDIEYIYVYDNNEPGDDTRRITINKSLGSWNLDYFYWDGVDDFFLSNSTNLYLQTPTIDPIPFPIEFEPHGVRIAFEDRDQGFLNIVNMAEASISITNGNGNVIGYSILDTLITNTFPFGFAIVMETGYSYPPIGYHIPSDNYSIKMYDFSIPDVYCAVWSDSLITTYGRTNANPNQTDFITYSDGIGVVNPDSQTKSINLQALVVETSAEKVFNVLNLTMMQADSIHFCTVNHDDVQLLNVTSDKEYALLIEVASNNGNSTFEHSGISLLANSTHLIAPNWTNFQTVLIYIDLNNDGTINDTLEVVNQLGTTTTFQLSFSVNNGWNIVSIPGLNTPDQNVNTWWTFRDQSANVFKYAGGYQSITDASPGIGYWMKHSGDKTYNTGEEWPAAGIQIVAHSPIDGTTGWNLMGGYEDTVTTSGLTTNPPGIQSGPVYKYSGGYQVASTLDPGYGYWIKLTDAGQIIIPETLTKGEVEYFPDDWGKIVVTDASGVNYTLYAVKGKVDFNQYELPPVPPAGMFDIRYSSGRIAEDLMSAQTIELSGVQYPLTVKVENINITLQDPSSKEVNTIIISGDEVRIDNSSINKLIVLSSGMIAPIEYALEQNYPNPFNPSTTIKFSIPKQSFVTLKIYDVLGTEVETLVDEEKPVGSYEIEFNGNEIASGIYFYKLKSGSFVETKKMVLLR